MKTKIVIIFIFGILCVQNAVSQTVIDLLSYSRYYTGSTARSAAMSGAFGALGGDVSVLSSNPAGIGIYRSSEFTLSMGPSFVNTNAMLNGNNFEEFSARFRLSNIGYIHTWKRNDEKTFRSVTFGLAYNRLSDFASSAFVDTDVSSSMIEDFTWDANNNGNPLSEDQLDNFYLGPAFDTYLIDFVDPQQKYDYYNDYSRQGKPYRQQMKRTVNNNGGIGEYAISLGANISDWAYIGATWGIHSVSHKESYVHTEIPKFEYLDEFQFHSDYTVNGTGMNFKAGVIFRPINMLRLGAAIHTPTRYRLHSELTTEIHAYYNKPVVAGGDTYYSSQSPVGEKTIKLSTPWRYNANMAVIIGTFGVIGVDAEYVDYTTAKFRPNSEFHEINREKDAVLRNALNLKTGAEFRIGPVSLRGGVAYYSTPFNDRNFNSDHFNNDGIISYSGGAGIRGQSVYFDMAYVYTGYPSHYYDLYRENPSTNLWLSSVMQEKRHSVTFTIGVKF